MLFDGNAWAGSNVIPNDPHIQNKNGKLLENFLARNREMHLLNASDICKGLITRSRMVGNKEENSIIDFVIICDILLPFVAKFEIDEEKIYSLSKYSRKKSIHSDHNTLFGHSKLRVKKRQPERTTIFNFKHPEGMKKFKQQTTNTNAFTNCFKEKLPVNLQIQHWHKQLKKSVKICFPKVRVKNNKRKNKHCHKFTARKRAIQSKSGVDIQNSEQQLVEEQEYLNRKKIKQNMAILLNSTNRQKSIWKIKKIFFPKIQPPLPIAKKDSNGQLISNPNELKVVYLKHFAFRMRNRPIAPGLEKYESDIKKQFLQILKKTKTVFSNDWTVQDLEKVLKSLKKSQGQDTMQVINEIFMENNIGLDLKMSLISFFNSIKNNQYIPDFLKEVYITAIPKGNGKAPLNLSSERGIFLVPKLRGILSKLIYNSIIEELDSQLSPSNIGARKGRSPRDHLFVVYAVVNETRNSKHAACIDLVFTDVSDCFNALWTEKTLLDLHNNGVTNNLLNLLNNLNEFANISIKTPVGVTEKKEIEDIIMQGETISSIACTSTMDRISKESKKEIYKYRNTTTIPKMGYIDDLLDVNKCGKEIKEQHEFTSEELRKQKLHVNHDKSGRMHISNKVKDLLKRHVKN